MSAKRLGYVLFAFLPSMTAVAQDDVSFHVGCVREITSAPVVSRSSPTAGAVGAATSEASIASSESGYDALIIQATKLVSDIESKAAQIKALREHIAVLNNLLVSSQSPEERERVRVTLARLKQELERLEAEAARQQDEVRDVRESLVRLEGALRDAKTKDESTSNLEERKRALRARVAKSIECLAQKPPEVKKNPAPSAAK